MSKSSPKHSHTPSKTGINAGLAIKYLFAVEWRHSLDEPTYALAEDQPEYQKISESGVISFGRCCRIWFLLGLNISDIRRR